MKHTDILLKQKPESFYDEVRDRAAAREKTLNNLQAKLRVVQELAKNEGWLLFMGELKEEKLKMLGMLERSTDPTSLAKVTGSLLVVESFLDWTNTVSSECEAAAKDLSK